MEALLNGVGRYFPPENGWSIVPLSAEIVDIRDTRRGSPIRCIDYRYGIMPDGSYDPDYVPRSPAWLGAIDGISVFLEGDLEERYKEAAELVRETGFTPADHGDSERGDVEGRAFRRAVLKGQFSQLNGLDAARVRPLRAQIGIAHITLHKTDRHPRGFLLNPHKYTTALPNNAEFYIADVWYPNDLGIEPERFLPVLEKCGQLLLPPKSRALYVVAG